MDSVAAQPERELPASVFVASLFGFAKAAFLGFMGIIGIIAWDSVTDPWGYGALAIAILFLLASYALLRGKPFARMVLGALAVIGGVGALIYVFVGPTSAIVPSLVTAALDAVVLWLLYGTRSAKEYFGS
jgi:hypothetical protein